MPNLAYNSAKVAFLKGQINLETDTIKMMLVTAAYSPDKDAHVYRSSVTDEVSGTGYTSGGVTISGKSITQNNIGDEGVFDGSDVVISGATITNARGAVMYKSTGSAATDPLIMYYDFGADKSSTDGDFTIQMDIAGILAML